MRFRRGPRVGAPSLRTRLLAGVLIPATLVLVAGGVAGVRLVGDAVNQVQLSEANARAISLGTEFWPALIDERAASTVYLSDPSPSNRADLDAARRDVDAGYQALRDAVAEIYGLIPAESRGNQGFGQLMGGLPDLRERIDTGAAPRLEAYFAYSRITEYLVTGNNQKALFAPSGASANRVNRSADLNRVADLADRAVALAAGGLLGTDLTRAEYDEIVTATGALNGELAVLLPQLDGPTQDRIAGLRTSLEWQRIASLADEVIGRGFGTAPDGPPPPTPQEVREALAGGSSVSEQLLRVAYDNTTADARINAAEARETLTSAVVTATLLLLGLVAAFAIALVVTTRLVRRLTKLRAETLDLAETSLPDAVARLRRGERLDLDRDIPTLDHGRDEIGQVAAAFNRAQRTAVEAAVEEAHTREGFNTAFLNIARRSQGILHQQMQVLDRIERAASDPDQLELLFSLDHLATRERRNAENLIILGGEQPRRQWRNPVALGELVRAAVGESEHYQRVTVSGLPHVMVDGAAVGDLVHLLAELVDNATAFSPPGAPVDVHGSVVGRGVVVEVEDQGLGIVEAELGRLNGMLREPPDFDLFTLSRDSRIGMFVVARLARRHGVAVTLRSSAFGGVRAGVLVPAAILAGDAGESVPPAPTGDVPRSTTAIRVPTWAASGGRGTPGAAPTRRPPPARVPGGRELVPESVAPAGDGGPPRLPRRRRQAHMDSRLLAHVGPPDPGADGPDPDPPTPSTYSPETARNRMAALRRGTARARAQDPGGQGPGDDSAGDHSTEGRRT